MTTYIPELTTQTASPVSKFQTPTIETSIKPSSQIINTVLCENGKCTTITPIGESIEQPSTTAAPPQIHTVICENEKCTTMSWPNEVGAIKTSTPSIATITCENEVCSTYILSTPTRYQTQSTELLKKIESPLSATSGSSVMSNEFHSVASVYTRLCRGTICRTIEVGSKTVRPKSGHTIAPSVPEGAILPSVQSKGTVVAVSTMHHYAVEKPHSTEESQVQQESISIPNSIFETGIKTSIPTSAVFSEASVCIGSQCKVSTEIVPLEGGSIKILSSRLKLLFTLIVCLLVLF